MIVRAHTGAIKEHQLFFFLRERPASQRAKPVIDDKIILDNVPRVVKHA